MNRIAVNLYVSLCRVLALSFRSAAIIPCVLHGCQIAQGPRLSSVFLVLRSNREIFLHL
jgi:hypothetical protein